MRRATSVGQSLAAVFAAFLIGSCTEAPTEPVRSASVAPAHVPVALAVASTGSGATFSTDKDDYTPGDTLKLAGSGWQAGDTLDIHLDEDPQNHPPVDWVVVVDDNGGFRDSSYVVQDSDAGVTFALTATSRATGETATATFTDGSAVLTITGISPSSPNPGDAISADLSVAFSGCVPAQPCPDWKGTKFSIDAGSPVCVNTTDKPGGTSGAHTEVLSGVATTLTAPAAGPHTLHAQLFTDDACTTSTGGVKDFAFTVTAPTNHSPTADAGGPYSGSEGAAIHLDGSGSSDPDGDAITYYWTVDYTGIDTGGECKFFDPSNSSDPGSTTSTLQKPDIKCTDDSDDATNDKFKVTLKVTDSHSADNSDDADLTVSNVAPSVSITSPGNYSVWAITALEFGTAGFVTASFSDDGTNDTHTCTIDWGDGDGAVSGSISEASGAGTCKSVAGNPYSDDGAGIYTITVKVTDDDTGEGTATVTIVVYDPSAGFVTGGGWINSPAGAYFADEYLAGRANFGFVSKYQKGANTPTGNTEFQFQAGNLNFHSDSYEWLVVNQNGVNAQFKGSGLINGVGCSADREGKCRFMLWAYDGTKNGGYDTFRIEIWTEDSGGTKHDIYDNGGTGAGGFSSTAIAGGSIQVQTGKK